VAQRQPALALGGELRPVVGDLAVQLEGAVLHEDRHHQEHGALGSLVDPVEGVRADAPGPQVDDPAAVHMDAQLTFVVRPFPGRERRELLPDRLETVGHGAMDLLGHAPSSTERPPMGSPWKRYGGAGPFDSTAPRGRARGPDTVPPCAISGWVSDIC